MANYNEIKRVIPSWSHLVLAVGGNRKVEEWEVYHRGRRKDWEAEKRSSKEIRWRERVREWDSSKPLSLSTVRWNAQGPTIVRGRVAGVGLGCSGVVSRWPEGALYHHYCHDLANWLSHYLYFFSFLFFSYLRLQDGARESITWLCRNVTMVWRIVTDSQVTSHSHNVSHD